MGLFFSTAAVIEEVDVLHSSFIASSQSCHWRVNADYQVSDYFPFWNVTEIRSKLPAAWLFSL